MAHATDKLYLRKFSKAVAYADKHLEAAAAEAHPPLISAIADLSGVTADHAGVKREEAETKIPEIAEVFVAHMLAARKIILAGRVRTS